MKTALKLGPNDAGRALTWDDYREAEYEEGWRYEVIEGRLTVSPLPGVRHENIKWWLIERFQAYIALRPDIVNLVFAPAPVLVPTGLGITAPEPDIALYSGAPPRAELDDVDWRELTPILVVEVVSPDNADKDFLRNPRLYHAVPSIAEYWVIDARNGSAAMTLLAHRRDGAGWAVHPWAHGQTYTTPLLPGFTLTLDLAAE